MRKRINQYIQESGTLLFNLLMNEDLPKEVKMKNLEPCCYFSQPPYRSNESLKLVYPANEVYQKYFMKHYVKEIIQVLFKTKELLDWSQRQAIQMEIPEVDLSVYIKIYNQSVIKNIQLKEYVEIYNIENTIPMVIKENSIEFIMLVSLPWKKEIDL